MTLSKQRPASSSVSSIIATPALLQIGARLEQNGKFPSTVDSDQTFAFPVPFKDGTIPEVIVSLSVADGSGAYPISLVNELTNNEKFTVNRDNTANNSDEPIVNWHAMGEV